MLSIWKDNETFLKKQSRNLDHILHFPPCYLLTRRIPLFRRTTGVARLRNQGLTLL